MDQQDGTDEAALTPDPDDANAAALAPDPDGANAAAPPDNPAERLERITAHLRDATRLLAGYGDQKPAPARLLIFAEALAGVLVKAEKLQAHHANTESQAENQADAGKTRAGPPQGLTSTAQIHGAQR